MSNMFRSAVFKLMAVLMAIVMVITIGFSVVIYKLTVQELQTGFHNQYVRWLTEYAPYGLRMPGNPAAELAARSHHILFEILYFNVLVLGVTSVASYLLARRVLRPIERAHEQQKRFTADVSHELRTPLTALKMDTEVTLLDTAAKPAELRATLKGNLEEANRMESLVNNLLQLAVLEANEIRTEFSKINFKDIAAAAVHTVTKLANSKHIQIEMELADGWVMGNEASLTQLTVILLENAIKYSTPNSLVHVGVTSTSHAVNVSVQDSGPGIPPEALPHIFDRFYRADGARKSQKSGGFGLGLSLAKLIADVHDAEIILTSAPGRGTQALVRMTAIPTRSRSLPFTAGAKNTAG